MADNLLAPFSYPISEYTTDPEMRQERVSQALGWDTSRPWRELGMRALTQLPLALGPGRAAMPPIRVPAPAGPPPQTRPGGPTQGQRDLYELTPATDPREAGAMMSDPFHRSMNDPVRSQRFWDAPPLHEAQPFSVPPSNAPQRGPTQGQRDFHSLDPRHLNDLTEVGAIDASTFRDGSPLSVVRDAQFWDAVRAFENMPKPPRNRLNALLPFAGAAATAPWLVPDEPY